MRAFSVALGATGSVTNVRVTISSGGANYSQTISIQPQDVVLIAEPISSAPILYPGKPLVPLDGDVRIVAMADLKDANGRMSSPTTYSYAWTVDGVQIANSSGIGKEAIIVASPLQYRARDVSVAVTNSSGILIGGASLSLTALEPSVRIYQNDPLFGIRFDRALSDSYTIAGAETTLYAAPFSVPTTGGAPLIQWFLNGSTAQDGASITLRPSGSGQGNASLSLVASSGGYTTATASISLFFGRSQALTSSAYNPRKEQYSSRVYGHSLRFRTGRFRTGFCSACTYSGANTLLLRMRFCSAGLATFFNNLYKYLIGLAAALAVIMIIWGGLEYSTQDSISKKSDGKQRIYDAIFGLVLVLSPVLVFSIINPSILNLSLNLQPLDTKSVWMDDGIRCRCPTAATAAGCVVTDTGPLVKTAECTTENGERDCPEFRSEL